MMAEGVDAEAEMEGLFAGDDVSQEQGEPSQSLTQEEAEGRAEGGANLDVTGAAGEVKKRVIRNPQPKLNADRLMGPRGIQTLEETFKDWKSKGKGNEFEDLDIIMKKMEHWAHRLFPKLPLDGVLTVIANREGKKKTIQTHVKKIRLGMVNELPKQQVEDEEVVERDVERYGEEEQPDVFEELLRQAGAQNMTAPPPVVGGLSEDQQERIRRNKELAERKRKERKERELREEQERLWREQESAALDEEEEMEREINAEPMIAASAASEWGNIGEDRVDSAVASSEKGEMSKPGDSKDSEKEKVTVEAEKELMNLDEMMEEMEQD